MAPHEDTYVPGKVLERSIIARAHGPVEIINTHAMDRPRLKIRRNPTPFSLVRFWVPELFNHKGWGIYLDADMVCLDDIYKLWEFRAGAHRLRVTEDHSVCLIDCAECPWKVEKIVDAVDSGRLQYSELHRNMNGSIDRSDLSQRLPFEWNRLDVHHAGATSLIHYTRLLTQPWKCPGHRFEKIWGLELVAAVNDGYVTTDDFDSRTMEVYKTWQVAEKR